jgi:hypothetical protein
MSSPAPPAANEFSGGSTAAVGATIPCLWFFLPLPHPLGLPTGWQSRKGLAPQKLLRISGPASGLESSLLIHQLEPSVQPHLTDIVDLRTFASATMKLTAAPPPADQVQQFLATTQADLSPLHAVRTIAEVAVPGYSGEVEDDVLQALDLAIDHVRFVQRAVASATQQAVRLIARATLPLTVPTFVGVVRETLESDPGPQLPEVEGSVDFFIPDCAPPAALSVRPEEFDHELLERLNVAGDRLSRGDPFDVYSDLRREAMAQRHFDGNRRMVLVALAAAGEVLLDTMLLHMLWEEQTPPEEAVRYFDRNEGHTSRVARYFPGRLGGGWDPAAKSPAGNYQRELVRLRHRVVHAGHEPTDEEVKTAWSALFELEHYLGDRLAAGHNLKRYTRTAMAWLAESQLRRRNRWTRHVQRLVLDPSEPDWVDSFSRWRLHVDRALSPAPNPPGRDPSQLMLYADRLDDGVVRWILHDPTAAHAAIVNPRLFIPEEQKISEAVTWLKQATSEDLAERRIGFVVDREVPVSVFWRPDHEIFPEFTIFPGTATPAPTR